MTYRMFGALIASLGVVALMLSANEAFARTGATQRGGFSSKHSISNPLAQFHRHHRRRNEAGILFPGEEFFSGPSFGESTVDAAQARSGDIHYTHTYDVPWDWAHRYPPAVTPSERPYVPGCHAQTVTVPGHDGGEQTVNITRCY